MLFTCGSLSCAAKKPASRKTVKTAGAARRKKSLHESDPRCLFLFL